MKRIIFTALLLTVLLSLFAGNSDLIERTERWYEYNPNSLPHWMTPDEILRSDEIGRNFQETAPPVGPVRAISEFDQMDGVMIRWPLGIPVALVAALSQEIEVLTVVTSGQQSSCNSTFQNNGVNMSNITYMNASTDSYWSRDFGPWFIMDGNDELGVVDFVYNRPRPNDDEIPITYANTYGLNLFGMNLEQTGGNYMCDGLGTAAQTQIAYTENGNNQTNVNNLMQSYLGIENYFVIDDPNNTYIDHIDCWGKFLAPDKVLIRSVPTSHAQYDEIEAVANFFASEDCAWGYPYEVVRVYTPDNQPYSNSLIINNRVFVPVTGSSWDDEAIQSYVDAMPGYDIIEMPNTTSAAWESTDALHCRTHELADEDMLYVEHMPFHGELPADQDVIFEAYIYPYSGDPLYADSLYVELTINDQPVREQLLLANTTGNSYETAPYTLVPGAEYSYYIHAADQSGRSTDQPIMGALDPHQFTVEADAIAPVITHEAIVGGYDTILPILVEANITDNSQVLNAEMVYMINDGPEEYLTLIPQGGDLFSADFDVQTAGTLTIEYKISATDGVNESFFPSNRWYSFTLTPTANENDIQLPLVNSFDSVYPSPVVFGSDNVTLKYSSTSTPSFSIYNVKGQKVNEFTGQFGKTVNSINWDLQDQYNNRVSSGIYFIRMNSNEFNSIKKLLIIE